MLTPLFSGVDQASFGQPETLPQALLDGDEMRNNVRILLLIENNLTLETVHLLVKVLNDQVDELLRLCTHWDRAPDWIVLITPKLDHATGHRLSSD
jgi:hypothetical protein